MISIYFKITVIQQKQYFRETYIAVIALLENVKVEN